MDQLDKDVKYLVTTLICKHENLIQTFDLLKKYKLSNKKVAIEHNGVIIPKGSFKKKFLKNNDKIEIVHFIGGG